MNLEKINKKQVFRTHLIQEDWIEMEDKHKMC